MSFEFYCKSHGPKAVAVATKTRPCIVLYKAAGNPREMCDQPIVVAGFCIVSFLKLSQVITNDIVCNNIGN